MKSRPLHLLGIGLGCGLIQCQTPPPTVGRASFPAPSASGSVSPPAASNSASPAPAASKALLVPFWESRKELRAIRDELSARAGEGAWARFDTLFAKAAPADQARACYAKGLWFDGHWPAQARVAQWSMCAQNPGPLQPYARLKLAYAARDNHQPQVGVKALAAMTDDISFTRQRRQLFADLAFAAKDWAAVKRLGRWDTPGKRRGGWQRRSLGWVEAILAGSPSAQEAEDAFVALERVQLTAPGKSIAKWASKLEKRVDRLVPRRRQKKLLTPPLRAKAMITEGLVARGRLKSAVEWAERAEGRISKKNRYSSDGCRLYLAHGRALMKRRKRREAANLLYSPARKCKGPRQARLLYLAGKAHLKAKREGDAWLLFQMLEKRFPKHRLADDARRLGSKAAGRAGHPDKERAGLASIADDYPKGDVSFDGLFDLILKDMVAGRWQAAGGLLRHSLKLRPTSDKYWAYGRSGYFLGRALKEQGKTAQALAQWETVVRDFPLGYYMVLSLSRIAELDSKKAAALLAAVQTPTATATPMAPQPDGSSLDRPQRDLWQALVELGDFAWAGQLAAKKGWLKKQGNAPAMLWLSQGYAEGGDIRRSHLIPRLFTEEWMAHYPVGANRQGWLLAYPTPYARLVAENAQQAQIPISLAYGVMREESAFDPKVRSSANAYGLMQLILPTAKRMAKKLRRPTSPALLRTPEGNVPLGCTYLGDMWRRFPNQPLFAIPSHNAGPRAPERWIRRNPSLPFDLFVESIPYFETRRYTKRVLKSMTAFAYLYWPKEFAKLMPIPQKIQ